ncbi:hypothetical protein JB92DRAFT_3101039 [Gautieria morchelliformis]|nr:hypothetical protein JB92DRAFT_3101039 [Gautieria morchelliformis]
MAFRAHYPFAIPSVADVHPTFRPDLVQVLKLNTRIDLGDVVDISDAQSVEHAMKLLVDMDDAVPTAVVETAKNRAAIIRNTHSTLQFHDAGNAAIITLLNQLCLTVNANTGNFEAMEHRVKSAIEAVRLNGRFDAVDERFRTIDQCLDRFHLRLASIETLIENLRIVETNHYQWGMGKEQTYPSCKKVAGSGTTLALALQIQAGPFPPHADVNPPAAVGTAPLISTPWLAQTLTFCRSYLSTMILLVWLQMMSCIVGVLSFFDGS